MDWIPSYYGIWAVLLATLLHCEGRCKFPRDWKGKWYQGGLGEVSIRSNTITPKGNCVDFDDNGFYLVEERVAKCYRCLLVMKRHKNILQYKESFCIARDTLQSICRQIRVESPLYTLVRDPHTDAACPFRDAYYFNYNDNVHDFCSTGLSYAKPCAGQSKFKFHFKHCKEIAMLHNEDMDFDCIATWKDGSDMFLYGKFTGPSVLTKDDSYRCFMYQSYGSQVYMAMSADTTCRGLRTPRDGPLIMEFTRDVHGWPQPACDFPTWLTSHATWRDLESRHVYEITNDERGTITITYRRRPDSRGHVKFELRCSEILERHTTKNQIKVLSFTSHNCVAKHQCVIMEEIVPNYLRIKLGDLVDENQARRCRDNDIDDTHLIIPGESGGTACPFPGRHRVLYATANCPVDLNVGCNTSDSLDVRCNNNQGLGNLQCMAVWPATTDTTNIIVRDVGSPNSVAGCIALEERADIINFSTRCERDVPNPFPSEFAITVQKLPDECLPMMPVTVPVIAIPTVAEPDEPSSVSEQDYESYDTGTETETHEGPYGGLDKPKSESDSVPGKYPDTPFVHTPETNTADIPPQPDTDVPYTDGTDKNLAQRMEEALAASELGDASISEVDLANTHGSQYQHIGQSAAKRPRSGTTTPSLQQPTGSAALSTPHWMLLTGSLVVLLAR